MTRVALITIAHGRHDHWRAQRAAVAASSTQPDEHILVAMEDPALEDLETVGERPPRVQEIAADPRALPLAHARNVGAAAAIDAGADVLIFLDVDCLPGPQLITAYRDAATSRATADRLLCGPVTYLEPPAPSGYHFDELADLDSPHPARPAPEYGQVTEGGSHDLFWSLSFALTADLWRQIGGFHESYVGYGAEDTDFAWTARAAGIDLAWIGSARAYHQYHETEDPPTRHLIDIMRNGALFRDRWGRWPMGGWLDGFVELGLIARTSDAEGYRLLDVHRASTA